MKVNYKENAMKMQKNNKKSGFTLVELMVVAIIVAILAAVAIPLMTGNKNRAIATEGQTGCSTIATAIKMQWVQSGAATNGTTVAALPGIKDGDLEGTYFAHNDYTFTMTDGGTFTINTKASKASGDALNKTLTMTVANGSASWGGTLLED